MSVTVGVVIGGLAGVVAGRALSYLDSETSGDRSAVRGMTTIALCTVFTGAVGAGIGWGLQGPVAHDRDAAATRPPVTMVTPEDEARAALEMCVGGAAMGRTIIIRRNPQGRMACTLE